MKGYLLFSCFGEERLDKRRREGILRVVREEFERACGIRNLEIETGNCRAPGYDLVFALEEYPRLPNVLQKIGSFRKNTALRLFDVIPAEWGYRGNLHTCRLEDIRRPLADETKEEPSPEEKPEEEGGLPSDFTEYREIAKQFEAQDPRFTFERLVLSDEVRSQLDASIAILENREKLFEQWGLKAIMSPSVLLNLYGSSGTGKTMAAEAIAHRLGKKIIRASYADIESKFHGEGPKRLKGIFLAARQQDAVLFIDEADSMLSARLGNVTQGSEQAINSMRSQLLISLENHDGIVIFATNLIENYDKAFLTRLVCVEMKRPDQEAREKIWHNHLYSVGEVKLHIPLEPDVDIARLAAFDFCGRDIRNAVKQACINAVLAGRDTVCQQDLLDACMQTEKGLQDLEAASGRGGVRIREATAEEKSRILSQAAELAAAQGENAAGK